jgi:hypothetical protein
VSDGNGTASRSESIKYELTGWNPESTYWPILSPTPRPH